MSNPIRSRNILLIAIGCLLVGCQPNDGLKPNDSSSAKTSAPDIVLISIDTLRADHLGCYGNENANTPNLDKLANGGALFESAFTTVPVTLPAHSSMLSGLIPPEHGVRDNGGDQLADSVETIAEVLSASGYQTGAFIGAEPLKKGRGLTQGFDVYDDRFGGNNSGKSRFEQQTERYADQVAAAAAGWIHGRKTDVPLFAFVHFFDPHWPYVKILNGEDEASYAGEIAYVDKVIGRLLESVKKDRDTSNLIVVVTSDHGEGLGEHGEKSHCIFVYDSTLHVPLIVNAPGRIDPTRITEPVSIIDVAPTILEIADIDGLADADGISLVDSIQSGKAETRDLYFESYYGDIRFGWAPLTGIRRNTIKYINAPKPELYDIGTDKKESNNLFDEENRTVAEFKEILARIGEGKRTSVILDDEAVRKLANLGYVSAKPADDPGKADRPDPKDRIAVYDQFQTVYQRYTAGAKEEALEIMRGLETPMANSPHYYSERAFFETEVGDWLAAIKSYKNSLALEPENTTARLNLAAAQIKTDKFSDAQKSLEVVLAVEPENAKARLYAGLCAKELGDIKIAIEHWKHFVRLAPNHPDAARIKAAIEKS